MNVQLLYCLLLLLGYALIVVLCEFLYRRGLHVEYTRKLAHCLACLLSLLIPVFFSSVYYALGLTVITFATLFVAYRKYLIASVNAVSRKTCGAYLLPVSIGVTYGVSVLLQNNLFFTLPVVVLAISDPLAYYFGKKYGSKVLRSGKTAIGTLAFFLSSFIISCLILYFQPAETRVIASALGISIVASAIELVSPDGSDNLTIPLSVIASLALLDWLL